MNQPVAKKPFHESIIGVINLCGEKDLAILENILLNTKIPKNHDDIIAAWKKRADELCWPDHEVVKSIFEQKQEAEKKETDKTFLTDDSNIKSKLMQLGHSFTQAVAEDNSTLAESIRQEALALKGAIK